MWLRSGLYRIRALPCGQREGQIDTLRPHPRGSLCTHIRPHPRGSLCTHITGPCVLQWGTLDFHARSLANLKTAMRRTRKLCAVILDTLGRECLANSQPRLDSPASPVYDRKLSAQPRDKAKLPSALLQGSTECIKSSALRQKNGAGLPEMIPRGRLKWRQRLLGTK